MQLRTQRGYDFYEVASALQKGIRRGDVKLSGYMALELFPKYSDYVWKRLLTISAEDCHGIITQEIKALHDSFMFINKGKKAEEFKGRIFISKAVIILCTIGKSRDADLLQNLVYDRKYMMPDDFIESVFEGIRKEDIEIPEYVFDVHTKKGKLNGKTKKDFFLEEEKALENKQKSLFDDDIFSVL